MPAELSNGVSVMTFSALVCVLGVVSGDKFSTSFHSSNNHPIGAIGVSTGEDVAISVSAPRSQSGISLSVNVLVVTGAIFLSEILGNS